MVFAATPTPVAVRQKIEADLRRIIMEPQFASWMDQQGVLAVGDSSAEAGIFLKREMQKWAEVVRTAGVRVE